MAAANPVNSKYDAKKSVITNIRLPPTLLSRLDLIYLMLDRINPQHDKKLADHILHLYRVRDNNLGAMDVEISTIPQDLMRKYIAYAREHINPKIPEELISTIVEHYV